MAGIGHMARKVTDGVSIEAINLMNAGFVSKKTHAAISREIKEVTGEIVNPRTIGRRGQEWRQIQAARREKLEEMRALVKASEEGNLTSASIIRALALEALMANPSEFQRQNPLKLQSQNLRAEELFLKREALKLKEREVAVGEKRLQFLQERERKAVEIAAELEAKTANGKSLTAEDIARLREIYGLDP